MRYKDFKIEELRILPSYILPLESPKQVRQDFQPWQYSGWEGKNQLFKLAGYYVVEFKIFNSPVIHHIKYTPIVLIDFGSIPRIVPRAAASVFGWGVQAGAYVTHDLGYRLQPHNRKFWDFVLRAMLEFSEAGDGEQFVVSRSVRIGGGKHWDNNTKHISTIKKNNALIYRGNHFWSIKNDHPNSIIKKAKK